MSDEWARAEFRRVLNPLVILMGAKFDAASWVLYWQALEDVPVALLEAAVTAWARSPQRFMPRPGELRQAAEDARQALSAAIKHEPCGVCVSGWIEGPDGARRCDCWRAHQARVSAAGINQPIALPPAEPPEATP